MYGFVKSRGLPPWPAILRDESGGRLKVSFLGTSRTGLIKKEEWIPYSADELARYNTTRNRQKFGAFKAGIQELRNGLNGNKKSEEKEASGDKRRKLNGDKKKGVKGLRKQQMENERVFREVMRKSGKRQWRCKRCNFSTGYMHRAKTHALLCTSMHRIRKKRPGVFTCFSCPEKVTFPSKKLLRVHSRKEHPQVFLCVNHKHPITFKARWLLMRHLREKHLPVGFKLHLYSCPDCTLTSKRKSNINRHIKRKHPRRQQVAEIIGDLISGIIQEKENRKKIDYILDEVLSKVVQKKDPNKAVPENDPDSNFESKNESTRKSNKGNSSNHEIVGAELSSYEIYLQKRRKEINDHYQLAFKEVFEEKRKIAQEKEEQRLARAALKETNKLRRELEGPKRKSPRLGTRACRSTRDAFQDNSNGDVIENELNEDNSNGDMIETELNEDNSKGDMMENELNQDNSKGGVKESELNKDNIKDDMEDNKLNEDNSKGDILENETCAPRETEGMAAKIGSLNSEAKEKNAQLNCSNEINKENIAPRTESKVIKKFRCEKNENCKFKGKDNYALKNHYRAKHEKITSSCSKRYCKEVFSTLFEKEWHMKNCCITCKVCGKSFNRSDMWESHQRFETAKALKMSL